MQRAGFIVSYLTAIRLNPPENNADSDLGTPREIPSGSDFAVIQCPEWCAWKPECESAVLTPTHEEVMTVVSCSQHMPAINDLRFNGMHHHRKIARPLPLLGANDHKL
jgi:hypothetical protein